MKKPLLVTLFLGIFMMLLTVVFSAVSMLNADIVGGAGWPTFAYLLQQYAWMAWIGALFVAASIVLMITKKK